VNTLLSTQPSTRPHSARGRRASFATTRWSVVLLAGRNDTERAREALAKLCAGYWYPLYVYARRRGHPHADAQDLTQAFFARVLARQSLAAADPARGRFRSFILTAMKNFLADEWAKTQTQRRGGETPTLSLDWVAAEKHYNLEPADTDSPDKAFDRRWAHALLEAALAALAEEYRADGAGELFAALRGTLVGERAAQPYAELGAQLGLSESAIKVAVHRLRKRYRARLRAEIAQTVATAEEVDGEMQHLFRSLGGA
jgi:RNA polymerase sigma-70 factor (ECF subfamily)